jgi:hypothetical protein
MAPEITRLKSSTNPIVLFEHFSLSEAFVMAGQIRRLTSQHRIFILQCLQTISHERKVFVRGVGGLASAETHKRGRIHGWHPSLAGDGRSLRANTRTFR